MFPIRNTVPTRYPPLVTWTLIAINCAVFFVQINLGPSEEEAFLLTFALIPARYFVFGAGHDLADYLPLLTNIFMHAGWLHLILNMWTLWLFGPAIEDRLGHWRYLAFYVVCGVLASAAHVIFNASSLVPALGASGAIGGVLGCYMRMFPLANVVVVVPIIFIPFFFQVPAFVFAGLWFAIQLLQGTTEFLVSTGGGGVAWWAHIGGFVAGLILGPLLRKSDQMYRPYYADEGVLGFDTAGRR
jgi:membrane associated rhomboid family serine protease